MRVLSVFFVLPIFLFSIITAQAQEKTIVDKAYRTAAVERLSELILAHYVYEDVAKKTVDHLKAQLQSGQFDQLNDLESFAKTLTETVQAINKDKHMRIRPRRVTQAPDNTPEQFIEEQLDWLNTRRADVSGFREVRKLDGNIGYLDIRMFDRVDWGGEVADRYMYLLAGSDAVIIDLRKNGGGDPSMVQYLCSYFFEDKVHLNSLYWREGKRTVEFWSLDEVGGQKMPDVPLFVLTSSYTFSGAEEFSYNMQTQKRATLIGETTGGGANPSGGFQINKDLTVSIPTGAAVNPITKTNWEGVGVVPEVKVSAEEALDKAIELAKAAAKKFNNKNRAQQKALLDGLQATLSTHQSGASDLKIIEQLNACHSEELLGEWDINRLGYEYLMKFNNSQAAEALLKGNTLLYPESANAYDSYGEALAANGKMEAALKNYQKAVELAKANQDPNLELFKENLKKTKEKLAKQ